MGKWSRSFSSISYGGDSFQIAASHEFSDQFKLLLEYAELDLDELRNDKEALLHTAARTGGINHVAYLIKNFANINIRDVNGHLSIHVAIKNGHHSVVKLLLACGTNGRSVVLTDFVARDDEIMLKILRDSTAQSRASIVDTLLHIVIRSGNLLAILLMIYTEGINQKNSKGETPLDFAERLRNQEARRHLINTGAEFNIRDECGKDL